MKERRVTKPDPKPETEPASRPRWGFLAAVALTWLVVDQATKFLAVGGLTDLYRQTNAVTLGERVSAYLSTRHIMGLAQHPGPVVVPGFWSFRYAENPGAAWSFAAGWPDSVRVPFFHLVSAGAIILIGHYYRRLREDQGLLRWALALVAGGALGNLVDRFIRGYVVDFIDWHLNDPDWMAPSHHWPTFNWADTGITVGVALIALDSLLVWLAARKAAARPGTSTAA